MSRRAEAIRASLGRRRKGTFAAVALGVVRTLAQPVAAEAQPLRLRGDALVQTRSPVGLLVLHGEHRATPSIDAETVSWLGATTTPGMTGDVLTMSVRARERSGLGEARLGRMIVTMGAVRPMHVDGVRGLVRTPVGTSGEVFAGAPVVSRFAYDDVQWAAGGRLGQDIGGQAAVGASYLQRRGRLGRVDEEAGADLALTPSPHLTAAARASVDRVVRGVTDALASVSAQNKDLRGELFVTHRAPGRMLPSTSLFSVLGDFAATSGGVSSRYRAFPRLELMGSTFAQTQADLVGGQGFVRTTLSLDDEWQGTLALEGRRVSLGDARWTGLRGIASVPLRAGFRVATELEIVAPDAPRGRGSLWPWALLALAYRPTPRWDVATAVEASSGPTYLSQVHALARLSYQIDGGSL